MNLWKRKLRHPLAISVLMVISQVANATGYALEKSKAWRKPEPTKPAAAGAV